MNTGCETDELVLVLVSRTGRVVAYGQRTWWLLTGTAVDWCHGALADEGDVEC
jgi:hypothetical protein